jgi:hypothetical protein
MQGSQCPIADRALLQKYNSVQSPFALWCPLLYPIWYTGATTQLPQLCNSSTQRLRLCYCCVCEWGGCVCGHPNSPGKQLQPVETTWYTRAPNVRQVILRGTGCLRFTDLRRCFQKPTAPRPGLVLSLLPVFSSFPFSFLFCCQSPGDASPDTGACRSIYWGGGGGPALPPARSVRPACGVYETRQAARVAA